MTRFLAGLACGAMVVGAGWYGNRLGYQQARADVLAAQKLAAEMRDHDATADRGEPELQVAPTNRAEHFDDGDCLLATLPPRPCESGRALPPPPRPDDRYQLGVRRTFRKGDDGGPWKNLPAPEISPADRAALVAELEARGRDQK